MLRPLAFSRAKPVANPLSQSPSHPSFCLEPNSQKPVAGKPGERCRGCNPLVIEFKFCLEFTDLQRLAKLALEDRLDAYGVSRFDKDSHGFHRQESADPSNFLR